MRTTTFEDAVSIIGTLNDQIHANKNLIFFQQNFLRRVVGNGRFHFYLLIATGFSLLGVIVEGLNMAFVLPAAKCDIEMTTTEQGLINAIGFIGVVLTSHFWGFMADTWGRLKVIRFSMLSGFVFSVISSFSVTSMMLLFTRLLVGMW